VGLDQEGSAVTNLALAAIAFAGVCVGILALRYALFPAETELTDALEDLADAVREQTASYAYDEAEEPAERAE